MLKPIKNILYTSDLSTHSTYAFSYAVSLANSLDAKLHVLHVVEKLSNDAKITLNLFVQDKQAQHKILKQRTKDSKIYLEKIVDDFWQTLPEAEQGLRKLVSHIEVVEGYPAEAILKKVDDGEFDMILIGAHAHGFSQTFLGSIAKRILRRANIPTMVVPYKE